ncbi:MAG: type III pantothenate kinase [Pirellulaceae bacterium]
MNPVPIAVDIGNSAIKFGVPQRVLRDEPPVWTLLLQVDTPEYDVATLLGQLSADACIWQVASVHRPSEQRLARLVNTLRPQDEYRLLSHRDLPLEIDVEYPDRVGMDRLVAAVAANRLRDPRRSAVVVDAGTALTVDAVSADGVFRGGVILAGFRMIGRALAADTDLLPLVEDAFQEMPPPVIGRSTAAAIHSGMFWGGVGAIRELVTRFTDAMGDDPQLFVTGGDAQLLASHVRANARFVPELALAGILWVDE